MSVARPALPVAAASLALGLLTLACGALTSACGAHPRAAGSEQQSLSAGVAPAPAPVLEASSPVLAAPVAMGRAEPAAPQPAERAAAEVEATPASAGGLTPLTPEQRATLLAGAEDSLAPTPIHYVKSNEVRHDVWFPYIRGVGGAYLGVGSDQNYTVAAVARSELMFLSDIDRSVVDLHRVYEVLIEASETPEQLHLRFAADQAAASKALLEAAFAELPEPERRRLVRLYGSARETVYVHLKHVIRRQQGGAPTSWLSDPANYAHIRALFKADRVRMMAGDLTGGNSLQSAAAAARALGVPFRVVYFSNAEEYFSYTRQFTANILALAGEPGSVVLRTIYSKEWIHADQLWAYQVQPLADFQRRLGERKNRSRNAMLKYAEFDRTLDRETGTPGLSLLAMPVAGG